MAERIIPYTQHDLICNYKMSINSDCDINSGTKVLVMLSIEVKTRTRLPGVASKFHSEFVRADGLRTTQPIFIQVVGFLG